MKKIKIFVASPSDVSKERESVQKVVDRLNKITEKYHNVYLSVFRWESDLSPGMGRTQELIFQQSQPDTWNVFIGILWNRFGSNSGCEKLTGTEEEFRVAYNNWKEKKHPHILFYRSKHKSDLTDIDGEQLQKVNKFFKEFQVGGKNPGFYKEYTNVSQFKDILYDDLLKLVYQFEEKEEKPSVSETLPEKYENLFTPHQNEQRNLIKKKALKNTLKINLLAHSGYSFLAQYGHRYKDYIIKQIKKEGEFNAILTNPWSIPGLFLALGETTNTIGFSQIDPIDIIENAQWYKLKFKNTIAGYNLLKERYASKIHIRFTKMEIPASLLLTDKYIFYEPYLPVDLFKRHEQGMLTFEIQATADSNLYSVSNDYFIYLWNMSEDIDDFFKNEEVHREKLRKHFEILY